MSEGKGQRKWPIPEGFRWNHIRDLYVHDNGDTWSPDTNEFRNAAGGAVNGPVQTESVEQEIQRKGLTAPRITPTDIENNIAKEEFEVFANSTLTVCVLTLQNGFTVVGKSACASPANFDAALGRRIARDDAKSQIWSLMGYALREKLHQEQAYGNS